MAITKKPLTGKTPTTKTPKPATAAPTGKVSKSEGVTTALRAF